jgi:putative hydrolase of the HAD superfamily
MPTHYELVTFAPMPPFKNIIFDFGGVIINVDYHRVVNAFVQLGVKDFDRLFSQLNQHHLFDDFEKGLISADEFRNQLKSISNVPLTDQQIDDAWNAILINLPKENIELLKRLKKNYRLFLLSNTNEIHEKAFTQMMMHDFGENVLPDIFEGIYFSHRMHKRKPDAEIFEQVLKENNLAAEETLFIDDSPQHIDAAKQLGIQTLLFEKGKTIADIFNE